MEHLSEERPGLQTAWDSTSMGALQTCPRKYQLGILMGWRQKKEALPLVFGIYYHSIQEYYHKRKADGLDSQESLRATVRYSLMLGASYELTNADGTKDLVPALEYVPDNRPRRFIPWATDDSLRNRVTLVQAFIWHHLHFGDEDVAETLVLQNGKAAVELSFRFQLPYDLPTGETPLWCGHLDRVVTMMGQIWTTDYKTTKNTIYPEYFHQFSPNIQMSGYTLGTKISFDTPAMGVMIDAIQLGVNFARPQRGFAHRTHGQLDEFVHDLKHWMNLADYYAKEDYWPMNLQSCDKFGGCVFRDICNKDKSVRQSYLQSHFYVKHWKPLESR